MNIEELNKWIETPEGRSWADGLKAPLIAKRDELLQKVKDLNEEHRTAAQQVNDLTETLARERGDMRDTLIDREVSEFVDRHVVPGLRQGAKALFTGLDVTVKADGKQRIPIVSKESLKGLPIEGDLPEGLPLRDYLETWGKTEEAKAYIAAPYNTGGGAHGGFNPPKKTEVDTFTEEVLKHMG
ncbi:hypothetical protein [Marispirochaeta aestuarii]|uniref:hypothetical protein n=1 Tax=Marispirochaeta aestuarii TaxID=1963862 RepID=UPI0029C813F2|nr:hypothetical protein [Marispirochaeta aestuarii]